MLQPEGKPRAQSAGPQSTPNDNKPNTTAVAESAPTFESRIEAAKKIAQQPPEQKQAPAESVPAQAARGSAEEGALATEPNAPADGETPAASVAKIALPELDSLNWQDLVDKLRLDGMVRELARNSDLANLAGGLLELTVEPQHENLKAERLVQGLQQALSEQADLQVQIRVVVAESGEIDTVAKRMSEAEKQRQREAEAVIAEDPTVRALQNEFGATIESISPR